MRSERTILHTLLGIQMKGMIEWGQLESKPRKITRTSNVTQENTWTKNLTPKKSHAEFPSLKYYQALNDMTGKIKTIGKKKHLQNFAAGITGSPSSKYKHRRASALLRNIRNIRICMGKKPIASVTYENETISIKNSVPYIKCVLHLSCVVYGPSYGRFMGCIIKCFLSIYKVYQVLGFYRTSPTDPPKENDRKFAPVAPIATKFRLGNTR